MELSGKFIHPLSKIKCLDIVAHALGRLWQENPFQFEANNLSYIKQKDIMAMMSVTLLKRIATSLKQPRLYGEFQDTE